MILYESHQFGIGSTYQAYSLDNFSFPLHFHRCFELIGVAKGSVHLVVDQSEYIMAEGDIAFIFPNQLHSFNTFEYSAIVIVLFSPELIGHFFTDFHNMLPDNCVFSHYPLQSKELQFNNIYQRKAFLYSMCSKLIEHTTFHNIRSNDRQLSILHQVLIYVDNHYSDVCCLSLVSKHLGYDYSYLSRLFKSKLKLSYTDYLNQFRIARSCYLLSDTQKTISDIALECGYDTIRSFNRNFQKTIGSTPKKYRQGFRSFSAAERR